MLMVSYVLLAYLLGSISFGVLASWVFSLPDPRTYGSKNPGATNVLRSGKKAAAVFTLLGDAGKGWLSVALAQHFAPTWIRRRSDCGSGAGSLFGSFISDIFAFSRGKRCCDGAGRIIGFNPWMGLLAVATWIIVAAIWRISSLSALAAAAFAPIYARIFFGF